MKKFIIIVSVFTFFSCSQKTYTFQGENLTKKQLDKKLDKLTREYIENNPKFVELWNGVEVVYDTIPKN
jgi:hypothetical protein